MQENYLISIIGRQNVDGELGEVRVTTVGDYIKKNGKQYIVYKEYDENQTRLRTSILKVEKDKMTMIRGDDDRTRLILENGKRHLCQYDTGFGTMTIGVFTQSLLNELHEKGGVLKASYTLDVNANLSSYNEIAISVKETGLKQNEQEEQALKTKKPIRLKARIRQAPGEQNEEPAGQ